MNRMGSRRKAGVPVGLLNSSNICYLNSLLQIYFLIPDFLKEIMSHKIPNSFFSVKTQPTKFLEELQILFAKMIRSSKSFAQPHKILELLIDYKGGQMDFGEFNLLFISMLEKAIGTSLSQFFYGKTRVKVTAQEKDGSITKDSHIESFSQIILDVEENDLYSAWAAAYEFSVEDFLTERKHKTTGHCKVLIEELPDMLVFQLNRVKFDKQSNSSIKVNKHFSFPQVVYPDRFLKSTKYLVTTIKNDLYRNKKKLVKAQKLYESFENFQGSGMPLINVLKLSAVFLKGQAKCNQNEPPSTLHEQIHSICDTQPTELLDCIEGYRSAVNQKSSEALAKMKKYQQAVDSAFDCEELKEQAYLLHGILMHQGNAGYGHYFAYIRSNGKWWKFNDTEVSEVPESQVFSKEGPASAYCLFYMSEKRFKSYKWPVLKYELCSYSDTRVPDLYTSLIPYDLLRTVDRENEKFEEEIEHTVCSQTLRKVQELYSYRYNQCLLYSGKASGEKHYYELFNFSIYLQINGFEELCRWQLLDQIVKEGYGRGLEDLGPRHLLMQNLQDVVRSVSRYPPSSLTLSKKNTLILEEHRTYYYLSFIEAHTVRLILETLTRGKLIEAARCVHYQLSQSRIGSVYSSTLENINKVLILRLLSETNLCIQEGRTSGVTDYGLAAAVLTSEFISKEDLFFEAVKERFLYLNGCQKMVDVLLGESEGVGLDDPPEELSDLKIKISNISPEKWVPGWEPEFIANQFKLSLQKFTSSSLRPWIFMCENEISHQAFSEVEAKYLHIMNGVSR